MTQQKRVDVVEEAGHWPKASPRLLIKGTLTSKLKTMGKLTRTRRRRSRRKRRRKRGRRRRRRGMSR